MQRPPALLIILAPTHSSTQASSETPHRTAEQGSPKRNKPLSSSKVAVVSTAENR
jgi:hypothetical protein